MLEFIFEFIVEIVMEVVVSPLIDGIMAFAAKIIPEEKMPAKTVTALRVTIGIIAGIMFFAFVIGVIAWFGAEDYSDKKMVKILLGVSVAFFAIVIVARIFTPNKHKDEDLIDK